MFTLENFASLGVQTHNLSHSVQRGGEESSLHTSPPCMVATDYGRDWGSRSSRYIPISRPLTEPRVPVHPPESPPICQANMLPPRSPAKITLIWGFRKERVMKILSCDVITFHYCFWDSTFSEESSRCSWKIFVTNRVCFAISFMLYVLSNDSIASF